MASNEPVEFVGDNDIDALLCTLEEGEVNDDPVFDEELDRVMLEMDEEAFGIGIKCLFCDKVCKSKGCHVIWRL